MRDTTRASSGADPGHSTVSGPSGWVRSITRCMQGDRTRIPGRPRTALCSVRMSSIARVEPLTTARALRGPFDYRIPREMEGVDVGSVLLVPFGRRRILGLVVDVGDHTEVPQEKLVEPVAPLEADVPPDLVELGMWLADAYCSTPARGLALVLPPGTGTASHATPGASTRELHEAALTPAGREALSAGARTRLGPKQHAALSRLAHGPSTAAELDVPHSTLTSLARRGLVSIGRREVARRPAGIERGATGGARGARAARAHAGPGGRRCARCSNRCASAATLRCSCTA